MAHDLVSYREGIIWMGIWAGLAAIGSYLLNPICTAIFAVSCLLEVVYCSLLRKSPLRCVISGIVKNAGGIAAVFAVDPRPSALFLCILFSWFFCWEIGGQNIPNDWADLEEDRTLHAQTLVLRLGTDLSTVIIQLVLVATVGFSLAILPASPVSLGISYGTGAILAGLYFLLMPAYQVRKSKKPRDCLILFNRASQYPAAMLLVAMLSILIKN